MACMMMCGHLAERCARSLKYSLSSKMMKQAEDCLEPPAEECKIDTLCVLIALGYNINVKNMYSDTALHNAARGGCVKAIEMLIANGADPNAQNKDGNTPLMEAVWLGKPKAVSALISHGADPGIKTDNGQTVLSMMSSSLADDAVLNEMLIAVGVESHKLLNIGGMPLISAAKQGDVELVRTLLDEGRRRECRRRQRPYSPHGSCEAGPEHECHLSLDVTMRRYQCSG